MLARDVAELLAATSAVVGPARGVAAAQGVLGADTLATALPYLQPLALSTVTRAATGTAVLDQIRAVVGDVTDVTPPALVRVTRLRVRTRDVALLAALAFAVHLLLPQIGDLDRTLATVRDARWDWLLVAVVFATTRYVASAVALLGSTSLPLPLGRTTLVQVAGSAAGKLAPAGIGGITLTERFLERSGATRADAVAAVGLDTAAGAVAHIALLIAVAVLVGTDPVGAVQLPPGWAVLAALAVTSVLAGVAVAIPSARRRVLPPVLQAWHGMRATLAKPTRAATLFGGSAALTLSMIGCLAASIRAFTPTVDVAAVALAYLVGSAVGSAAPTPGGLGVMEAALVAALIGLGVPSAPAVAGVLTFRLLTYWVPIAPGALALRRLLRSDRL